MALVLCIETATTNCSVALVDEGKVIAKKEENHKKYSHGELLHSFIEAVLNEAQLTKDDISAVAVSQGPGSYTGLRIGVSAAKGLCFALDVPLLAVSTLKILAQQAKGKADFIVPMLDARRMEVYSAIYSSNMEEERSTRAEILSETSFEEILKDSTVVFIGDGAEKFKPLCASSTAKFITNAYPSAADMAQEVQDKMKIGDYENVAYFEPYYLKEFLSK